MHLTRGPGSIWFGSRPLPDWRAGLSYRTKRFSGGGGATAPRSLQSVQCFGVALAMATTGQQPPSPGDPFLGGACAPWLLASPLVGHRRGFLVSGIDASLGESAGDVTSGPFPAEAMPSQQSPLPAWLESRHTLRNRHGQQASIAEFPWACLARACVESRMRYDIISAPNSPTLPRR
jgi:hypothetical protein